MTINSKLKVGEIINKIQSTNKLIKHIKYKDSFKDNHTFKITFSSQEKNLTQPEVNEVKNIILKHFN